MFSNRLFDKCQIKHIVVILALIMPGCVQVLPNIIISTKDKSTPFVGGKEGYACYRAPAIIITNKGTVLAFCEGRVNNASDEGDIDIVLKRSIDGGKTWGRLIVLGNDGINRCKNACPVVLPTGRILVVWLWNKAIPSKKYRTTRDVYMTYSDG